MRDLIGLDYVAPRFIPMSVANSTEVPPALFRLGLGLMIHGQHLSLNHVKSSVLWFCLRKKHTSEWNHPLVWGANVVLRSRFCSGAEVGVGGVDL